ncbi:hypothetical protein Patl1_24122 [Pistacia atlantica]|uniref:Uncharacterized protein n=1 Tax=Pistacia atlantica TaxID=434234 RepID=A0ACC0ZXW9_9ROSI|nr:hypothetical protein Patl1_24122 [Pistacia atlantica]
MSLEYTTESTFLLKPDIFSFGVLLLEIISRKKNKGFCHLDHHHKLMSNAACTNNFYNDLCTNNSYILFNYF